MKRYKNNKKDEELYNNDNYIPVTRTFLPKLNIYNNFLKKIWQRGQLTNNGPLVRELEARLQNYLQVDNLLLLTNGTLALQIAYKTLDLAGEVITTPFSYVATTSSLIWEGLTPIFVDIDPLTFNIDPQKIEQAITPKTTAIVATHVFGNPCDIEEIAKIAKKHSLKVIYDAAHAFGVKYKNKSIFSYGDISITSLHATKIFHTVEGGIIIANKNRTYDKSCLLHNFGHNGPGKYKYVGINAKMSELHAAMGLAVLPEVHRIISKRKKIIAAYDKYLDVKIKRQKINNNSQINYAYYAVVFENQKQLLKVLQVLNNSNIYPRRYFYPSLNKLPYVKHQSMVIAEKISRCILCLPIYSDLNLCKVRLISDIINRNI